ncbi:centrosomal protein of 128 kDa-like isoform X3 [Lineus longissimus]|uniref:centrosomal protein of 128 kDa-like isoform X3 n=1 Tax=Lineus longissimus TaxID=88925 RepID=UPI00315C6EA0
MQVSPKVYYSHSAYERTLRRFIGRMDSDQESSVRSDISPARAGARSGLHAGKVGGDKPDNDVLNAMKLHAACLDTNRNLKSVDRMLSSYRDINEQQTTAMDKLRGDMNKTMDQLKEERMKTTLSKSHDRPLRSSDLDDDEEFSVPHRRPPRRRASPFQRDYSSDAEYRGRSHRRPGGPGVRFQDDTLPPDQIHELHQSLRELSTNQERLRDELKQELEKRGSRFKARDEIENRRHIHDLSDNLRRSHSDTNMSVERRLAAIQDELKSERRSFDQRRNELGKLSSELRTALTQHQQQQHQASSLSASATAEEQLWRSKLSHAESQKRQMETDMENIKRRFDQSEGSKTALMKQMDELRQQLSQAERERSQMRNRVEEIRTEEDIKERKRLKAVQEEKEYERKSLEKEIHDLKVQLTRSTQHDSAEIEDLKRLLDRTERQRSQMSDHVDVLKKDVENKEKHTLKLMTELQDVKVKQEQCERQRDSSMSQLEDALRQLRDVTRDVERYNDELKNTERQYHDSEKKREEMRCKAQETVKMWKLKCKRLEKEVDKYRGDTDGLSTKQEQLLKENECLKCHLNTAKHQLENMKKEMGDILSCRAQQEEQLRLRDNELCDVQALKHDLEKDVRDYKCMNDRLKEEIHSLEMTIATSRDEKGHLEEKLSTVQASNLVAQDENKSLRREIQEVGVQKAELSAQLNEVLLQRQELKKSLQDCHRTEQNLREEISALTRQMREDSECHLATVDDLRKQAEEAKCREARVCQDINRRMKRDQAEYEAHVQALQIELSEEKSNIKIMKRQDDKLRTDVDRLQEEVNRLEDENMRVKRKLQKTRQEMDTKLQIADDDLSKSRRIEQEVMSLRDSLKKLERDQRNVLHTVGSEIDAVVEIASLGSAEAYNSISISKASVSDPVSWMAEMKSKLQWLRSEVQHNKEKEQRLKMDVKDVVQSSDSDRKHLVSELYKQQDVVDDLVLEKNILERKEQAKLDEVIALEEQVLELSDTLRHQKTNSLVKSLEMEREKQHIIDDIEDIKDSHLERERIQERYERLQKMVSSLKDELADTRKTSSDYKTAALEAELHAVRSTARSPISSPKPRRRVRIDHTPPTLDLPTSRPRDRSPSPTRSALRSYSRSPCRSPSSLSPVRFRSVSRSPIRSPRATSPLRTSSPSRYSAKTPPPLAMSDEEFHRKFVPASPRLCEPLDDY